MSPAVLASEQGQSAHQNRPARTLGSLATHMGCSSLLAPVGAASTAAALAGMAALPALAPAPANRPPPASCLSAGGRDAAARDPGED